MMPDDRYRDIYDCLVSDGVAKDVAKEHDTAPSNICVIADEVRNLCAGQGWKYYEPTPGRRKTGYVEMATHRNAVGKALVCESYRHLPGRPKK